mmetsp:Transcript_25882/g.34358  ORF Transcript_25882/g.34358 Transcript_25882/m.34358 type:complete len:87 (-) Transcript_25882:2868-3128(-)
MNQENNICINGDKYVAHRFSISTSRRQSCRPVSRLQRAANAMTCPNTNIDEAYGAECFSEVGLDYCIKQESKGFELQRYHDDFDDV